MNAALDNNSGAQVPGNSEPNLDSLTTTYRPTIPPPQLSARAAAKTAGSCRKLSLNNLYQIKLGMYTHVLITFEDELVKEFFNNLRLNQHVKIIEKLISPEPRPDYGRLGELRRILPRSVPFFATSATLGEKFWSLYIESFKLPDLHTLTSRPFPDIDAMTQVRYYHFWRTCYMTAILLFLYTKPLMNLYERVVASTGASSHFSYHFEGKLKKKKPTTAFLWRGTGTDPIDLHTICQTTRTRTSSPPWYLAGRSSINIAAHQAAAPGHRIKSPYRAWALSMGN